MECVDWRSSIHDERECSCAHLKGRDWDEGSDAIVVITREANHFFIVYLVPDMFVRTRYAFVCFILHARRGKQWTRTANESVSR